MPNKVIFDINRIGNNMKEYKETFSLSDMEMIYDALIEHGYTDTEDDNQSSRIMNKLYNLIEV